MKTLLFGMAAALIATCGWAQTPADLRSKMVDGRLMIFPGEQALLDISDPAKPRLLELKASEVLTVEATRSVAANTVLFNFRPSTEKVAMLSVAHGLATPLRYHAALLTPRGEDLVGFPTTICPVRSKIAGIETWGDKPTAIVILSIAPTTPEDTGCVE